MEPTEQIRRMVADRNYVGAGLYLKESGIDQSDRYEPLGSLVTAVVDDLSETKNRERINFLRATLAWILEDAPGLAKLYREAVREPAPRRTGGDIATILRAIGAAGEAAGNFGRAREDSYGDREQVFRSERDEERRSEEQSDFGGRVRDFFEGQGLDVDEGLKRASEFFESFSRRPGERDL